MAIFIIPPVISACISLGKWGRPNWGSSLAPFPWLATCVLVSTMDSALGLIPAPCARIGRIWLFFRWCSGKPRVGFLCWKWAEILPFGGSFACGPRDPSNLLCMCRMGYSWPISGCGCGTHKLPQSLQILRWCRWKLKLLEVWWNFELWARSILRQASSKICNRIHFSFSKYAQGLLLLSSTTKDWYRNAARAKFSTQDAILKAWE